MDNSTPLPPPPRGPGNGPAGGPTTASAGSVPPTPPPAAYTPTPSGRRLYRSPAGERVIGGVAAGLADYTGVPPGLVRLLFILTAFTGGVGILAYIVGLIAMPERPAYVPASTRESGLRLDSAGAIAGVVLIVFAVSILFADVGWWSGSVVWALLLIGAGVLLYRRADAAPEAAPDQPSHRVGPPPPVTGETRPGTVTQHEPPSAVAGPGYRGPGGVPPRREPPVPVRPRPRPRSPLGRMTVAAALVVTGVALWLQQVELVAISGVQIGALVLAVLGVGLLIGTFWGRARWLVIPAVLLAVPLLIASTFNVPFTLNAGERRIAPIEISEVAPAYSLGAGELEIDLSALDLTGRTLAVEASVGIGELVVTVPEGAAVEVTSRVGLGELDLLGQVSNGSGLERTAARPGDEGRGTLQLDSDVVLGTVTVRQPDDPQTSAGGRFRGGWHNPRPALENL